MTTMFDTQVEACMDIARTHYGVENCTEIDHNVAIAFLCCVLEGVCDDEDGRLADNLYLATVLDSQRVRNIVQAVIEFAFEVYLSDIEDRDLLHRIYETSDWLQTTNA